MKVIILTLLLLISSTQANVLDKAGKFYISYGYNKSAYTNSDITLKGDNYEYTLTDVEAADRQTKLSSTYLTDLTIPQFNLRIGYFIDDTTSISFGEDHMKYVVDVPQTVTINGTDHQGNSHTNGTVELDGFLNYEHTDGLNYINVAYNKFFPLWVSNSKTQAFSLFAGAGAGLLIPRSNIELVGHSARQDEFKIAGYGLDVQGGVHYDFFTNVFVRGELKTGWIDMPWISTSSDSSDKASQSFGFFEYSVSLGYMF